VTTLGGLVPVHVHVRLQTFLGHANITLSAYRVLIWVCHHDSCGHIRS
jgi:hypothetical protein